MLLKHIVVIGGHRQMVLELHRGENLVDNSQSEDALANVKRVALKVAG